MAIIKVWEGVSCLAVSEDGEWIAAGTDLGEILVWDAKTYEQVFEKTEGCATITGVDFSPDSTRLVGVSQVTTATVWDIATSQRALRTLDHTSQVLAAKYSPQGDRIATATWLSVRVWDSNDGRLLVDIPVEVIPRYNTGLLWFNSHIFVISNENTKEIDASTGSLVSGWPVSDTNYDSCISLLQHGNFVAYSARGGTTVWDTSTHNQLCSILQYHNTKHCSIALSPDGRFLAIAAEDGKIIISRPSHIVVSFVHCRVAAHLN